MDCNDLLSAMKCLNAIYKKIVFEDKDYEPEQYELYKRAERILNNPVKLHEICSSLCNIVIIDPPPLPLPQFVNMAYFRNYEQDNRLSEDNSTDIQITDIDVNGNITVNFIPEDVRKSYLDGQTFYVLNRSVNISNDNDFMYMQLYAYGMDEFVPDPSSAGGTVTLDFIPMPPYTDDDIVMTDIFHVGDLISFVNPMTVLKRIYPHAPLIDYEEQI